MSELIISVSGLRGIVGETLTPEVAASYVAAFAAVAPPGDMLVARDSRPSGQMLAAAIRAALQSLSPIEQRCVALMAMGWNFRQIASVTGLKYQAAITTTDVAVRKMRKLMSKQSPTPKHAQ